MVRASPRERATRSVTITERRAAVLRAVVASYVGAASRPRGLEDDLVSAADHPVRRERPQRALAELAAARPGREAAPLIRRPRSHGEPGCGVFVDELVAPVRTGSLRATRDRLPRWRGSERGGRGALLASEHALQVTPVSWASWSAPRVDRPAGAAPREPGAAFRPQRLLVVLIVPDGRRPPTRDRRRSTAWSRPSFDRIADAAQRSALPGRTLPDRARAASSSRGEGAAPRGRRHAPGPATLELGAPGAGLRPMARRGTSDDRDAPRVARSAGVQRSPAPARLLRGDRDQERLLEVLDQMLAPEGVSVAFGEEFEDPALRRCALVATPYGEGAGDAPLGVLGVIGPSRMDFSRVIALVDYFSKLVTGKLRLHEPARRRARRSRSSGAEEVAQAEEDRESQAEDGLGGDAARRTRSSRRPSARPPRRWMRPRQPAGSRSFPPRRPDAAPEEASCRHPGGGRGELRVLALEQTQDRLLRLQADFENFRAGRSKSAPKPISMATRISSRIFSRRSITWIAPSTTLDRARAGTWRASCRASSSCSARPSDGARPDEKWSRTDRGAVGQTFDPGSSRGDGAGARRFGGPEHGHRGDAEGIQAARSPVAAVSRDRSRGAGAGRMATDEGAQRRRLPGSSD